MSEFKMQDTLYAFVAVDPDDGDEGVLSVNVRGHDVMCFASDEVRLNELWPHALMQANFHKDVSIKLVKWTKLETVHEDIRNMKS